MCGGRSAESVPFKYFSKRWAENMGNCLNGFTAMRIFATFV